MCLTDDLDALKAAWQCAPHSPAGGPAPVRAAQLRALVAARLRRERRVVGQYVWASACWQVMVYAALGYLAVRFRADRATLAYCAVGLLVYVPFTAVFLQKFRSYFRRGRDSRGWAGQNMYANAVAQHAALSRFFRFKRGFDVVAIPVTALVLVLAAAKLKWVPAVADAAGPSIGLFGFTVGAFALSIFWENKKRFAVPLQRMRGIIQDIEAVERPERG